MAEGSTHHILLYEYVEDMAERRGPYREDHLKRIREQQQDGHITLAGALGDPPTPARSCSRTSTRATSRRSPRHPYVKAGLVTRRRIEPWRLV